MAAAARRTITITYSGAVEGEQVLKAANNVSSPATISAFDLAPGVNTFTVPTGATAVTIVKQGDNTIGLTFKVAPADTGIRLHDTDPDSIALHSSVEEFTIIGDHEAGICPLRLFFS